MWNKRSEKRNTPSAAPPKDTLIIVGNGFDCWQGLDTSYAHFQNYYTAHRDEILKKLGIKNHIVIEENGKRRTISDVELIYGDPFDPGELNDGFWSTFETSLAQIDSARINFFFGKERRDLKNLKRSIRNANRILREAFCSWIGSIAIEAREPEYHFGERCLFLNFNYTDTLRRRFGVAEDDVYHIHGEASDQDSIVVGHSAHPQFPLDELSRMHGRFKGLLHIEELLYETDKHVEDHIEELSLFLAARGVNAEDIKDVYVLGHSMRPPDLDYYHFLNRATSVQAPSKERETIEDLPEIGSSEEFYLRLSYVIERYGYGTKDRVEDPRMAAVVERRLALEQMERNRRMEKRFFKALGIRPRRMGRMPEHEEQEPAKPERRTEDALWHLSYFKDDDRQCKEEMLKRIGCKNYELFPSIDDCLKKFRT